ncbi:hypothetical protein GDO81_023501 [Engystomops pustulosus]|uniref:Sarcospan n=1 Tax=Engystomops pustulosus TaxID=76066 RepID=A0AAV6YKL4_ENGPU|nr:hypothetical protein GDO81_023501 [Engystomops pustulosus]
MGAEEKRKTSPRDQAAGGSAEAQQTPQTDAKKKKKDDEKSGALDTSQNCCGCRFPLLVALLQLTLGVSITVVAIIMAINCSSLLVRDTPHWAGIIVSIAPKPMSDFSGFSFNLLHAVTLWHDAHVAQRRFA